MGRGTAVGNPWCRMSLNDDEILEFLDGSDLKFEDDNDSEPTYLLPSQRECVSSESEVKNQKVLVIVVSF